MSVDYTRTILVSSRYVFLYKLKNFYNSDHKWKLEKSYGIFKYFLIYINNNFPMHSDVKNLFLFNIFNF